MAQPEGEINVESEGDTGAPDDDQLRADGVLWGIISDIENLGYEVQPLIIPACAVNAPHRRDRIWIIAYRASDQPGGGSSQEKARLRRSRLSDKIGATQDPGGQRRRGRSDGNTAGVRRPLQTAGSDSNASHASGNRRTRRGRPSPTEKGLQSRPPHARKLSGGLERPSGDVTDATSKQDNKKRRNYKCGWDDMDGQGKTAQQNNRETNYNGIGRYGWTEPWPEVAARLCLVDDGLSRRLVRLPDGRKISRSKWRQEALRSAGNAIVPAVVEEIMRGIKEINKSG